VTTQDDASGHRGGVLVVAHLSDLHLGAHAPDAVESLVADVASAAPVLTVVTGDLTMRARRREFEAATGLLRRLPGPQLVVLGNHDLPLDLRRVRHPYDVYRRFVPGPLAPVVDLPGIRALGLPSMPRWRWKSGYVPRYQATLVETTLGTAPPGALRLLALHHPPSAQGVARLAGRDRLLDALAAARVDVVLAGHTHVPTARLLVLGRRGDRPGDRRGVVEVVAGSATSTRLRRVPRSWSLVRADASSITVEEREQTGSAWGAARVVHYPRVGALHDVDGG
jgi:3',5'-cyclic AMP phosphodiesterase CpdA